MGVVEPLSRPPQSDPLVVANCLVQPFHDTVPLRMANLGDEPVVLPQGTTVGVIKPVSSIPTTQLEGSNGNRRCAKLSQVPEHLQEMARSACANLNDDQSELVCIMILDYEDVFAGPQGELGRTNLLEHRIDTGDNAPIRMRPRRQPYAKQHLVEQSPLT